MNVQKKQRLIGIAGALVFATGLMVPAALAQTATKGAEPIPFWWFTGEIEAGGRFFVNNPQKDGINSQGGKSLSKYYEYNDKKPGPFVNGRVSTGTSDGLYQIDLWGNNIGYEDQRIGLSASKAGQHYFNFQWDETPHNYGSGLTLYNGVGTNNLTLPAGVAASLYGLCGGCIANLNAVQGANVKSYINSHVHQTDLGIRRDNATVEYRWTPTDAWDVHINYDHLHRTGTQVDGVVFAPTPSGPISQIPRPVDDTTDNFGLNGEYAGTSPWGKKFTFKLGYSGSIYQDANSSYTIDDPFCPAGAGPTGCAFNGAPTALKSLAPDNQANGFNATIGANLPMQSRYVGNVSYNMMRQNQNFLPFTNNTGLAFLINGQNPSSTAALPASSLNGAINTLMSNNVLTTKITPELTSKLSYRYYDYDNNTPELYFPNWVLTDSRSAAVTTSYAPVHSLSISYNKQNVGAGLNWRPSHAWNLGVDYGHERYDWTRADVNVTNENTGKFYADWKPATWLTARASWLSAARRYDNYNALANFGGFQWTGGTCSTGVNCNTQQSTAMRSFYLNDRDRNKGQFSVDVDVIHGLTLTPTFGFVDDVYKIDRTQVGLTRNQSWTAGIDLTYVVNSDLTFSFSYMNEQANQNIRSTSVTSNGALTAANTYSSPVKDNINTFMAGANYWAIPDKLNFDLRYTVSLSDSGQPVYYDDGQQPGDAAHAPGQGRQYPNVHTTWQRFDATAKYRFDKETVQKLGWKGDVTARLRYSVERNSVDNWQNDMMQTSMYTATAPGNAYGYIDWLAYDNPNYNVQIISASLTFKW